MCSSVLESFAKCLVCHNQYIGEDHGGVSWENIIANGDAIIERLQTDPIPLNQMPPDYAPEKVSIEEKLAMVAAIEADIIIRDDLPVNTLNIPAGFKIEVYADVPGARSMALADDGTVFVGTGGFSNVDRLGRVWAVRDLDGDHRAESVTAVLLDCPLEQHCRLPSIPEA